MTGVICPGFPVHIFPNALEIAKRKALFLYIFPTAFPSEIRRDESRNIVSTCGVNWQAPTPSERMRSYSATANIRGSPNRFR